MNPLSSIRIAFAALRLNLMRSMLTMLGIIIGVASVITMIAVGAGAEARIAQQIDSLGSNLIIVVSGAITSGGVRLGFGTQMTLSEDDAQALQREVPEILVAAPGVRGTAQIIYGNLNWSTVIFGTTTDFLAARDWGIAQGRPFEQAEEDRAAKVALLGQTVASTLFGSADPVGQLIRIKKVPFTVVGVLDRKGQSMQGQDQDDTVVMPLSTARNRVLGGSEVSRRAVGAILVKMREGADMHAAGTQIHDLLRQRHHLQPAQDDDFWIRNLSEVAQAQEASSRVLTLLLAAVASVSLVVGGIGIMNIMLVSVTERTREIGLRLAVGARSRDILSQFLIEALTLSLTGGLIGIAVGAAAAFTIGHWAHWQTELSVPAILLAVGFAAVIGVFFGFYPARKASRLQPIEALRYE
ncbi:FtsX-like permease family protein [Azospirillum sp. TSA2s]|uniref:ABC transporter permease n=1 Tax=Azospirillum sp. TSA2s TaxID=709810 RepID=UPI0010AA5F81|nr:ABC transporter permease [Azospirillum sp. TSA2s]QCG94764.1 FtsX-like permease family protein [Azospirillum sp. TSA2s]